MFVPLSELLLVGVNHLTAPLASRERISVLQADIPAALAELARDARLSEVVLLSTCSRVEVYASAGNPREAEELVRAWFLRRAGAPLGRGIQAKAGPEAVRHLFRVVSGLDSWIVGESEIQGQVKCAYQAALERGRTGRLLNQLFQAAIAAGKSVRAATGIQNGIHSIGGAAAMLAKSIFSEREKGRVIVFGAGEAAEAVARHLAAKYFRDVWVANRTLARAQAVAAPLGGRAVSLEEGLRGLAQAEAAVFSAASPEALLDGASLKSLIEGRRRPLFLIDVGMPRNVAPDCARLPDVYLYDLDDLKGVVLRSMEQKSAQKSAAEELAARAAGECLGKLEKSLALAGGRA